MRIYKFGGASVKDATGVKNVKTVLEQTGFQNLIVVVSAMGKTTNALEEVVTHYLSENPKLKDSLDFVKKYHYTILNELFEEQSNTVFPAVDKLFESLENFLTLNKSKKHPYVYDQVVSYGELLSTTIVSAYLNHSGIDNLFFESRTCMITESK